MPLPEISHLQFQLLSILGAKELSGRELRAALAAVKHRKTRAAFYQLMDRLTQQGLIRLRVVQVPVGGGASVPEHYYKLTGAGQRAVRETLRFYEAQRASAEGWMPGLGGA